MTKPWPPSSCTPSRPIRIPFSAHRERARATSREKSWPAAARAAAGKEFAKEVALARQACKEHGMRIGLDGVQLLGGHGFVKEHPVERWYRDLRAVGVMEGAVLV